MKDSREASSFITFTTRKCFIFKGVYGAHYVLNFSEKTHENEYLCKSIFKIHNIFALYFVFYISMSGFIRLLITIIVMDS